MEIWIGMVVAVYILNIASSFQHKGTIRITALFLLVLVTIMSAIRNEIGEDYSSYVKLFYVCDMTKWIMPYPEISFQIIVTFMHYIGLNHQSMFCLYSIAISIFIWKSSKIYVQNQQYRLLFISMWVMGAFDIGWWFSMNVIRQYLAVSIMFYAYNFLIKSNYKKYVLLCLISSIIHISSLLLLIFPVIMKIRCNKLSCYVMVFLTILFSYSYSNHFITLVVSNIGIYAEYLDINKLDQGIGFSAYFFLIQCIFLIYKLNWNIKDEYVVGVFITIATMLKFTMVRPYSRINAFFSIMFIVAWIMILARQCLRDNVIVSLIILGIYAMTFLYNINAASSGHLEDWRVSAGNINYTVNMNLFDE